MCGILGTNSSSVAIQETRIQESIAHRGPDSHARYLSENVSFLITRLAIVNVDFDDQPVHGCDSRFTAIFNGEIYNFKLLSKELELLGHEFPEKFSDAAIIPHLFEEYGTKFVEKIDGMFAIAIWDNEKNEITLFRDSIGIKPLFYHVQNGKIYFSSEIRSLLEILEFDPTLEFASLKEFSSRNLISSPFTIFKDVFSLEPGTYIQVSHVKTQIERWATVRTKRDTEELNIESAIDEFEDLLVESINDQVNHGNTTALLLSGGLDSSLIAYIMKNKIDKEINAYHLAFETSISRKNIETTFARNIAKELSIHLDVINIDAKMYFNELDDVLNSFSQPFGGVTSTYFISREISKHHKVCLTGDGADELFGSYRNIQRAAKSFYRGENNEAIEISPSFHGLDEFLNLNLIRNQGRDLNDLLNHQKSRDLEKLKLELNVFDYSLIRDQLNLLPDQVLLFSDHLGMAHSLEIRPPFLSKKIVDFSRRIPLDFLIDSAGTTKKIVKGLGLRYFNSNFVNREKEGFLLPLEEWFSSVYAKKWVYEKIEDYKNSKSQILNIRNTEIFINRFFDGFHNDFFRVYRITTLMHFLKNYE